MIKQGIGRSAYDDYPRDTWKAYQRKQLENGDRLVMLREKDSMHAALFTFFDKDDELHWILHADGHLYGVKNYFETYGEQQAPSAEDYSNHPNFGRF